MSYAIYQKPPSGSQSRINNTLSSRSIIDQLSSVIHEVQSSTACCSSCSSHALTNGDKDLKELCRILNNLFSAGLQKPSEGYWPLVREFTSKAHISDILQIWKPQTSKGKSLAWLYQCLNDVTLEFYVRSFVDNFNMLNKFYNKTAFMLDKQTLEMVAMYLRGLDDVNICLLPRQRKSVDLSDGTSKNGCPRGADCCNKSTNLSVSTNNGRLATTTSESNGGAVATATPAQSRVGVTSSRKRQSVAFSLLEQSVADFSGCPDLLGLSSTDTDLLLTDAELCDEALDFIYPNYPDVRLDRMDNLTLPGLDNANRLVLKKRRQPAVTTKFVPKIVETTAAESASSLENSINNDFNMPPTDLFNCNEVSCSTPITQTDADAMFREIIKGRRVSPDGSETPPKFQSPVETRHTVPSNSSPCLTVSKKDDSAVTVLRHAPSASSTLIETSQDLSKSEFYSAVESESGLLLSHADNNVVAKRSANEKFRKSENIHISPRPRDDATITPPNTCVVSNGFRSNLLLKNDDDSQVAYSPRSAFERQILNRLENVVFATAQRSTDSLSEKSGLSETSSKKRVSNSYPKNPDDSGGTVESAADPQSARTESSEMFLESGEVLELAVHVMKEGEQFYKMFRVFCNHHLGSPLVRYLLLSNTTLYLLISESDAVEKANKYKVEFRISYSNLDYISVGLNGQLFSLNLHKRQCIVVCTASDSFTRSILSNLELAIRRAMAHEPGLKLPSVLTDATPQKICLNKWIMGEIGVEDNVIHQYSLIYWNPNVSTKVGTPSGGPNRNGYLYMREFYPNGWIRKSTDWQQSYFILRGKKFYQFEDLQCKFGKRVFDLQDEVIGCRQAETAEHTYCIELIFQDDSVVVQLSCPTKHELQQWLHAFVASFSQAETAQVTCACLSCCAVITNGFILLGQETTTVGFVRTLAISRLDALHSFKVSRRLCSLLVTVPSSTVEDGENWLLCFISESELNKFVETLKALISHLQFEEIEDECEGAQLIRECYQHWSTDK